MTSAGILKKQPRYSTPKSDHVNNEEKVVNSNDNDSITASGIKGNVVERSSLPNPFASPTSLHDKNSSPEPKKIKSSPPTNSLAQLVAKGSVFQDKISASNTECLNATPMTASDLLVSDDKIEVEEDQSTIETDLEFACMAQEDYQPNKENEMENESSAGESEEGDSICSENEQGQNPQFVTDDDLQDQLVELSLMSNGAQIDGLSKMDKMGLLMFGDMEAIDESLPSTANVRPFLIYWQPISSWTTHVSAETLMQWAQNDNKPLNEEKPTGLSVYDKSDIGYSRCNGLMAMIKMNLPGVFEAINTTEKSVNVTDQKKIEFRMGVLARSFDFSLPVPKLSPPQWKIMTLLLSEITMVRLGQQVKIDYIPLIVKDSGLTFEEYKYLTRSSIVTLSCG